MKRFIVRKNTLPYVHQWAVVDRETGNKVGEYTTEQLANHACKIFDQYGPPNNANQPKPTRDAWKAAHERMKRPGGDQPPKPPRHSNKRPVELD